MHTSISLDGFNFGNWIPIKYRHLQYIEQPQIWWALYICNVFVIRIAIRGLMALAETASLAKLESTTPI